MPIKAKPCRFCAALETLDGADNVAEIRDGILYLGGLVPTDTQLDELANEAMLLSRMSLWKILSDTVKAQAVDMGIRKATDYDQLLFAKAMLHLVGVQRSVLDAIADERKRRKGADVV